MWPDVGIKISPKFPKSVIAVFTSKVVFSNWPKSQPKFWATFAWIFVAKNIQKSPDLVTLSAAAVVPFSGEKNPPGLLSVKLSLKVVERFKELACLHFPFESPPQTFLLRTFSMFTFYFSTQVPLLPYVVHGSSIWVDILRI